MSNSLFALALAAVVLVGSRSAVRRPIRVPVRRRR
jgi:hypothetical protein